jgi:hypothetical protein
MQSIATIFECCIKARCFDEDSLKALGLEGERIVDGPVASHKPDEEDEILTREGVWKGLDTFNSMGKHVDWEHQFRKSLDPKFLIGQGVKTYQGDENTPRLATKLFKGNQYADSAWDLLKAGGELGYSVEAKATARDPKNSKRITGLKIYRVTLATSPMGHDSRVRPIESVLKGLEVEEGDLLTKGWVEENRFDDAIASLEELNTTMPSVRVIQDILINKAYVTGATIVGVDDPPSMAGEVSALRRQNMIGDSKSADYIQPPVVERKKPRKREVTLVEGLISKGLPPNLVHQLVTKGCSEDSIMAIWDKLKKYRRVS